MASLPGTQKQVKREVIDVEDYFGDGEVEITGYRQSPAVRSAPRSGRKVKTKEVIEILDDEEEESMLVDPPVDIRGRSVASSRQIQGREIDVSGGRKAGTSKVVVEVPSVRSILKHVNHHGLENVESDDEGSIDYNTWMGKGEVKMDVDDVQDESTFLPSAFELDDVKPETLVQERQRVRIAEKFMSRPASSNLTEQRASRFPRLWNLSKINPFSTQTRHPDEFGEPFTNPGNRTTHIWNPKRRVAFRSSLTVPSLHLVERYKKTSGTVTKIVQSHGFVAVASATSGGGADPPNNSSQERPQIDPYNEDGNLVVWTGREFCKVKAHERTWFGPAEGGASPAQGNTKFYTVNDVAFDPLRPTRLFSTGNDCALRVWDIKQTADSSFEIPQSRSFNYPNAPNDIAFKPKSSVLAVGCYDGSVYVHHDGMNSDPTKLAVADKSSNHRTGAFLWGGDCEKESGRLHNMLFALSEADIEDEVCRHVALDVTTSKAIYTFSCTDSGDAIALDDRSESLAIITRAYNRFILSMYDVSRHDARKPTALTEIALSVPGSSTQAVEHTFASFSPDGILLALGRSDNVALIYDVRFLSKSNSARPVTFRHHSRELTAGFGITGLRWVEGFGGRSLGLLTAGSDGCVRLWDTAQAPQSEVDNTLIAELNHDVACFSLGDSSKREQRLVVADCGGDVYVYN